MIKTSVSLKTILSLSIPLILGSLGYNAVAAADTLFLGRFEDTIVLAAIGMAAPFYLVITLVGLAFTRGAQILIAKRMGAGRSQEIGSITQNMFYFQMMLAIPTYIILKFFNYQVMDLFIDNEAVLIACSDYLYHRIDGIFFGFGGVVSIAFYSGIARTTVLIYNTLILAGTNIILNYLLIFGNYGFPELGIQGAGIASAIAEVVGFLAFLTYMVLDKSSKEYQLFRFSKIDFDLIKLQWQLSTPIAMQTAVGLVSWFLFFSLLEKMGTQELAISTTIRVIYIFLGVTAWGMGSATSTLVGNLLGQNKKQEIFPTLIKITLVCMALTALLSSTLFFFPTYVMQIVTNDLNIIQSSIPLLQLLFLITLAVAAYTIFYNGIVGVGGIRWGLYISLLAAIAYISYAYFIIAATHNLLWAWTSELIFALVVFVLSIWYIRSSRWRTVDF